MVIRFIGFTGFIGFIGFMVLGFGFRVQVQASNSVLYSKEVLAEGRVCLSPKP